MQSSQVLFVGESLLSSLIAGNPSPCHFLARDHSVTAFMIESSLMVHDNRHEFRSTLLLLEVHYKIQLSKFYAESKFMLVTVILSLPS